MTEQARLRRACIVERRVRMDLGLAGNTAIVTGGARDIGLAIAKRSHRISPGGERGHTYIPGTIQE